MRFVIVGAGSVGYDLCVQLQRAGHDVSMIDKDPDRISAACERLDILMVNGSGSSPSNLEKAGIRDADAIISVSSSDEVNLLACSLAAQFGVSRRVARLRNNEFTSPHSTVNLDALGVSHVIDPEQAIVRVIEQNIRVSRREVFNCHEGQPIIRHHLREACDRRQDAG